MSEKVFYHALGLRGYEIDSVRYTAGGMIVKISQPREKLCCACCGSSRVHIHGTRLRRFLTVPVGLSSTWIEYHVPRLRCQSCAAIRQVRLPFVEGQRRYTKVFERLVVELSRFMTPTDVSRYLGISWDVAREIQARDLKRKYGKPKLGRLKTIAIDEIYLGSKHKYITLVMDLETGAVVYVGLGKSQASLQAFWKRLKSSKAKIKAVASDLSSAYAAAIRKNLPQAAHVFDRFHITKLFNEKLTILRRELHREAVDKLHKDVLKGTRWLLLKNPENLDEKYNERQRLEDALSLNQPLATAYYLKDELRCLWELSNKSVATKYLELWCREAEVSGIRVLIQFAKTLRSHRQGILDWYDYPISTGPLEGTNNKIKLMQRRAYGYRDLNFLTLKILGAHKSQHALVG